jgi:hypothetical protein
MVVVRPPEDSYILSPGLVEESFDVDTPLGRVNLLKILFDVVTSINSERKEIADLLLILSGPVTYFYSPGGGIPWGEIREILIHPLNLENVGFRTSRGSLELTEPLMKALTKDLEKSGFTVETGQFSVIVRELGGLRITLYNPVEIGFSASLWGVLDPATSVYIGSPENLKFIKEKIAFLPDKRTTMADQFIHDAKNHETQGDFRKACKSLAGAAQVLGKIGLRLEIYDAYAKNRISKKKFNRFLKEAENAKEKIDALWRFQIGQYWKAPETMPIEPVRIILAEREVDEFTALCRNLGIVCIAARMNEAAVISLDRNELEKKISEAGADHVPQFPVFFEEITDPADIEKNRDRLIRIHDKDGTVRYYDLRKE